MMIKDIKAPASNSYRESLISSLKDLEHAADYIGVMLELDEDGYNPNILRSALEKVVEARKQLGDYSLSAQQYHEKLDKILAQTGGNEILTLIEFLDVLGYRIAVVPKEKETNDASNYGSSEKMRNKNDLKGDLSRVFTKFASE